MSHGRKSKQQPQQVLEQVDSNPQDFEELKTWVEEVAAAVVEAGELDLEAEPADAAEWL